MPHVNLRCRGVATEAENAILDTASLPQGSGKRVPEHSGGGAQGRPGGAEKSSRTAFVGHNAPLMTEASMPCNDVAAIPRFPINFLGMFSRGLTSAARSWHLESSFAGDEAELFYG